MDKNTLDNGFQSLAGMLCCSNLIEDLPLPTVNHRVCSNKSLFNENKDLDEAKKLLISDDVELVDSIEKAMSAVDTQDIELYEGVDSSFIDFKLVPRLMKLIMKKNNLNEKFGFAESTLPNDCDNWNIDDSVYHGDNPDDILKHVSDLLAPLSQLTTNEMKPGKPVEPKEKQVQHSIQIKQTPVHEEPQKQILQPSQISPQISSESIQQISQEPHSTQSQTDTQQLVPFQQPQNLVQQTHENFEEKIKQQLSELRVITETIDLTGIDDDEVKPDIKPEIKDKSEKKKKKKKKHKHKHKSPKPEESNLYSIKRPNCDSAKIVVSLVKRPQDDQHSTKKHKKKKKKDKDKELKHEILSPNNCSNEPVGKIKLKVARNGDNAKIISSTIPFMEKKEPDINLTDSPLILKSINKLEEELSGTNSKSLIPSSKSTITTFYNSTTNINTPHKYSQNCDLKQQTSICAATPSTTPTKMEISSTSSYVGTPTTDRISQCSNNSANITTNCHVQLTQLQIENTTTTTNNNNINNSNEIWNQQKAQNNPQQISEDHFDLTIPIDITGDDLLSPLNLNGSNNSLLNSMLSENVDSFFDDFEDTVGKESKIGGPGSTFDNNREPSGLSSYLTNGSIRGDNNCPKYSSSFDDHSSSQHNRYRRPKKRKNELEGLKTWFVGSGKDGQSDSNDAFPNQESSWDKAIHNISQSISEKKKKRNASRQANHNSAFLYEHDEEYTKAAEEDELTRRTLRGANATNYCGMDDEYDDDFDGTKAKRRKKDDDDEPFEVKLKDPNEIKYPHLKKCAQENNKKRRERVVELTKVSNSSVNLKMPADMVDTAIITESNTFQRFLSSVEQCLDMSEEIDITELLRMEAEMVEKMTKDPTIVMENYAPEDALISRDILQGMCSDISKLKATGCTKDLPEEKMSKLCTLLMLNIKNGARVIIPGIDCDNEENQSRVAKEIAVEKVGRSLDSSFIVINIMTSPDISKGLIIEDVIDSVVFCVKHNLNNLVFPEYDPAYRVKSSNKDNQMSMKWKRARERETTKSRSIIYFYNRIVDIISSLAELVCLDALTDTVILQLSTIAISVFFVENVNEIQLVSLRLITIIFSKYEKHRDLIIKDIFSSLNRLPSSKKNLRLYRLNSEESIQMLTALSLLLVQSVVNLDKVKPDQPPSPKTSNVPAKNDKTVAKVNNTEVKEFVHDREVLIESCYNNSLQVAYNFLNLFLQKATMKGEDDYKMIFDNFVTDLLLAVNKPEWPAAETMLSMLGSLLMKQFTNKQLDQSTRVTCIDYMGNVAATLRRDSVNVTINEEDIEAVIQDLLYGSERSSDEEEPEEVIELDSDEESSSSPIKNGMKKKPKQVFKSPKKKNQLMSARKLKQMDKVMILRDAILDYLEVDKYDLTSKFARQYYFGQWFSDYAREMKTSAAVANIFSSHQPSNHKAITMGGSNSKTSQPGSKRSAPNKSSNNNSNNNNNNMTPEAALHLSEERKRHLFYKLLGEIPTTIPETPTKRKKGSKLKQIENGPDPGSVHNPYDLQLKGTLDYEDACLACRYLASLKPFSQSFDIYISKICRLLDDNSVAVRTKSMRCLSTVVEADSSILSRKDIEMSVNRRLLDSNSSVREAAVELVGKYLLTQPQLISLYYPMIADRILDKGTSVRKRVIRIFRDICIEHSEFPKVPEICVKMIRRINDEESIKKLVNEVFQNMWFCPVKERETVKLLQKVMNITDVVSACSSIGYEWFDQLLEGLLKREDQIIASSGYGGSKDKDKEGSNQYSAKEIAALDKVRTVERACRQIVDCLVQNIMRLEEISQHQSSGQRLVSCLATLHLFTKVRPALMVQYAMTLQPYLSNNARRNSNHNNAGNATTQLHDTQVLLYVTKILELVVPLMEHPAPHFISQLEHEMMCLMMSQGKTVLAAAAACLSSSVNRISLNYPIVRESFIKLYYTHLKPQPNKQVNRPLISRALFTVGLLCKHFDLSLLGLEEDINTKVFETLMIYAEDASLSCDIRTKAISGIGFLCVRHKDILCSPRLSKFYHSLLLNKLPSSEMSIKDYPELVCCILDNISLFLVEEDLRMRNLDFTWKSHDKKESLKEMGDVNSSMGSRIAQLYLQPILESVLQPWTDVRTRAINLLSLIIRQGLTSPVSAVPYLIAAQTDPCSANRVKADMELTEIDKRFGGFVNIKAVQGIKLSCQLQEILDLFARTEHLNNWFEIRKSKLCPSTVRGVLDASVDIPLSLNHNLYTMLRSSKSNRRGFLNSLLALFDDGKSKLSLLVYVADNLSQFPYQSQEEPLYIVHQIEFIVSAVGPTHIQQIKMAIYPEFAAAINATATANANANAIANANTTNTELMETEEQKDGEEVQDEEGEENIDCLAKPSQALNTFPEIMSANTKLDAIRFDDDDDPVALGNKIRDNEGALKTVRSIIRNSRGVLLLIALKQYLRELYSLTDAKVSKYNPADSGKAWERQLTRRQGLRFEPLRAVRLGSEHPANGPRDKKNNICIGSIAWEDLYNKMIDNQNNGEGVNDNEELFDGEIRFLIGEFQHLRNLVLSLDPLDIVADSDEEVEKQQTPVVVGGSGPVPIPPNQGSEAHNMAVIKGQGLRVELDKLDLTNIPQIVNSKRLASQKKTLVPQLPIGSSDEDEMKERRLRKSTNQIAKTVRKQRPSRYATTKKRPIRISSSDDSPEDDSDPDFLG